jgi:hypothetical protein
VLEFHIQLVWWRCASLDIAVVVVRTTFEAAKKLSVVSIFNDGVDELNVGDIIKYSPYAWKLAMAFSYVGSCLARRGLHNQNFAEPRGRG